MTIRWILKHIGRFRASAGKISKHKGSKLQACNRQWEFLPEPQHVTQFQNDHSKQQQQQSLFVPSKLGRLEMKPQNDHSNFKKKMAEIFFKKMKIKKNETTTEIPTVAKTLCYRSLKPSLLW
jgi:hypothetical protein